MSLDIKDRSISNFFDEDYTQFAVYDVARKIGHYVDGLKISSRKIVHTVLKQNINTPKKVAQLQSKVAEECVYLHGEASLGGVIVGLAQNFVGTNNINLLYPDGNFGDRLIPRAAATRYIFTCKEKVMDHLFKAEDQDLLIEQYFEGDKIEPLFFVPTIPMILINGSEALSTGFSQKILSRNPADIIEYLKCKLTGKKFKGDILPWYKDFEGDIIRTDVNSYRIRGKFTRTSATTLLITEIPIGYSLDKYTKHLTKLEEMKKIADFTDMSNDGKFRFEIKLPRETMKALSDDQIFALFKLETNVTENLTCNDENGQIRVFGDIYQLMDAFIDIKMLYLNKRKANSLMKMKNDLDLMMSKYLFIKGVVEAAIDVNRKTYEQIAAQLEPLPKIIKVDDSYEYLLRMAISSLTKEKYLALQEKIKEVKATYDALNLKTIIELWQDDIKQLEGVLK